MYIADIGDALEDEWTAKVRQLHGLSASLAQARKGFEATGDVRYKDSVKNVLPYYKATLDRLNQLKAMLGGRDVPSQFALTLSDFSDWAISQGKEVVESTVKTVSVVPKILDPKNLLPLTLLVVVGILAATGVPGEIAKAFGASRRSR